MKALCNDFVFTKLNDIAGDCGTTLSFLFDNEKNARDFSEKVGGTLPIDTGKHVYYNWASIFEKRGALHPAMNPFIMPQNCVPDYKADMCPNTLGLLSKMVYIFVSPDSSTEELDALIEKCKSAQK